MNNPTIWSDIFVSIAFSTQRPKIMAINYGSSTTQKFHGAVRHGKPQENLISNVGYSFHFLLIFKCMFASIGI